MWISKYPEIIKIVGLYMMWVIAHYISAHLYANYCTKPTVFGFITSPFLTMSPQCQAGRWIIYNGAYTINVMWMLLAKWIVNIVQNALPNMLFTHYTPKTSEKKKL